MSILDLEDVAQQRVAGSRLEEIVASLGVALASETRLNLLLGSQLLNSLSNLVCQSHVSGGGRVWRCALMRTTVLVGGFEVLLEGRELRARLFELVD